MTKLSVPIALGESPLTDVRSLGSSALFHVLVVLLASLTALNVALPMAASRPKALYAELDPIDNRADVPSSPGQGGGSFGDIGGIGSLPFIPPSDKNKAPGGNAGSSRRHVVGGNLAQFFVPAERVASACLARPADDRPGADSRLGFGRAAAVRGRFWRRCRPRASDPGPGILRRCAITRSFLRLRHRLLRQHAVTQLTGSRQTWK